MRDPKTTLFALVGYISTVGVILGAIGSSCGGGQICGWFTLGALIVGNVARDLGNHFSADTGGH